MSGPAEIDADLIGLLAARLDADALRPLGRSLALYPLAAGDCGACALELAMLRSTVHSLARYGLTLQDSPVGADVLLLTGAMTRSLQAPVQRALEHMGRPSWVVAIGDCAIDGGPFRGSPPVAGGADACVPVDLVIPGCPPPPAAILAGLRTLLAVNTD